MNRRIAHAAQIAAVVLALVVVPAALAAKGGHGGGGTTGSGTGTINPVLLSSTDGLAHFGQKVTFSVSTSATSMPWVTLYCYQGGTQVYKMSNGIFPTSLNQVFTLGPTPLWTSGAGNCTAYLQNWDGYSKRGTIQNLASTSFDVAP